MEISSGLLERRSREIKWWVKGGLHWQAMAEIELERRISDGRE
jgi:hypothetical protein